MSWINGGNVPGTKVPGSESSQDLSFPGVKGPAILLRGVRVPGNEMARERMGQGTKGPRSELAAERIGQGPIDRPGWREFQTVGPATERAQRP